MTTDVLERPTTIIVATQVGDDGEEGEPPIVEEPDAHCQINVSSQAEEGKIEECPSPRHDDCTKCRKNLCEAHIASKWGSGKRVIVLCAECSAEYHRQVDLAS